MSQRMEIAVVLPPRERFRPGDAGAVALTIRDFVLASRWRENIGIFGGFAEHFPEFTYQHVAPDLHWLLGRNLAYARACRRALRASPARLIEVHNRIALALRLKSGLPDRLVALHLHNDPQGMDGARTVRERQQLVAALDAIYCVSGYVRERLLEGLARVDAGHVHVIYNAMAPSPPVDLAGKRRLIAYTGRFIPEKGVLELAGALAQVLPEFPDWQAVLVGAWGFGHEAGRSRYEQQVYAALECVAGQVSFRGHVPHPEVLELLQQAAIAVAPSTGIDAFNRAAVEAMDSGCATIVSTMGGLRELAGEAALTVDPVTPDALAHCLRRLMADKVERGEVAVSCQQRVQRLFSLPTQVAALDAMRHTLLASPGI